MSTRANIIIKDAYSTLFFYRHSDGYPDVTLESLKEFVKLYTDDLIRTDANQSAGWLILHGYKEYLDGEPTLKPTDEGFSGWKVGAYEPTGDIHGDIEYLYTIDLVKRELFYREGFGESISKSKRSEPIKF